MYINLMSSTCHTIISRHYSRRDGMYVHGLRSTSSHIATTPNTKATEYVNSFYLFIKCNSHVIASVQGGKYMMSEFPSLDCWLSFNGNLQTTYNWSITVIRLQLFDHGHSSWCVNEIGNRILTHRIYDQDGGPTTSQCTRSKTQTWLNRLWFGKHGSCDRGLVNAINIVAQRKPNKLSKIYFSLTFRSSRWKHGLECSCTRRIRGLAGMMRYLAGMLASDEVWHA